jgi:hypothetical protein
MARYWTAGLASGCLRPDDFIGSLLSWDHAA